MLRRAFTALLLALPSVLFGKHKVDGVRAPQAGMGEFLGNRFVAPKAISIKCDFCGVVLRDDDLIRGTGESSLLHPLYVRGYDPLWYLSKESALRMAELAGWWVIQSDHGAAACYNCRCTPN